MDYKSLFEDGTKLIELLSCAYCKLSECDLYNLGSCDDAFCRDCCNKFAGETCPSCGIQSFAKEATVNRQLSMLSFLSKELIQALKCGDDNDSCHKVVSSHSEISSSNEIFLRSSLNAKDNSVQNPQTRCDITTESQVLVKNETQESSNNHDASCNSSLANGHMSNNLDNEKGKSVKDKHSRIKKNTKKPAVKSELLDYNKTGSTSCSSHNENRDVSTSESIKTPRAQKRRTDIFCLSPYITSKPSSPSLKNTPKRNSKGETRLHIASIKGEIENVKCLLAQGFSPNVQDNAGWTPLHEACIHGHDGVVRVLLEKGALVNIPGSDNDSPLHDAVANGHIECARLLTLWGASCSVRNSRGLTPLDFCTTHEMRKTLESTQQMNKAGEQNVVDLSEYEQLVMLGTSLSREQRSLVQKCAGILHAALLEEYSPGVTHVITQCNADGQCPRTLKCLEAILSGKWVLNIGWIKMCIEYGNRVDEEPFEVTGTSTNPNTNGPRRGRLNRLSQLPGLFDGCKFYFYGSFNYPTPSVGDLTKLVLAGGGSLLTREPKLHGLDVHADLSVPYHTRLDSKLSKCSVYVIYDHEIPCRLADERLYTLPASWIMDCAASFAILDPPFS